MSAVRRIHPSSKFLFFPSLMNAIFFSLSLSLLSRTRFFPSRILYGVFAQKPRRLWAKRMRESFEDWNKLWSSCLFVVQLSHDLFKDIFTASFAKNLKHLREHFSSSQAAETTTDECIIKYYSSFYVRVRFNLNLMRKNSNYHKAHTATRAR